MIEVKDVNLIVVASIIGVIREAGVLFEINTTGFW